MLLFPKKKRGGRTLEAAMDSEGSMEISAKQKISRGLQLSFLKTQNPVLRTDNIALCIFNHIGSCYGR